MVDDGAGVSHAMLADMMTRGFSEQRDSVRRVHERCAAMETSMAALRAEQARIAENSTHLAAGIDRTEKASGELAHRLEALERPYDRAKALAWAVGLILGTPMALAAFVGGVLTLIGVLRPPQ